MPTFLALVTVLFTVFLSYGQKPLSLVTLSHLFVIIPLTFSQNLHSRIKPSFQEEDRKEFGDYYCGLSLRKA